ncbi:coproporphyrinogen III oxidase, partial [Halomonas sp. 707D4]|nr:coproporphyrinogen III oxidase [Halomonas sp. 707D4]
ARLSLFNYAHLPTRFAPQRRIDAAELPGADEKLAILRRSIEMLDRAGYVHIGMDHFARPEDSLAIARQNGTLQRNFQGYSSHAQCDLIGLGVSAISRVDDVYAQNPVRLDDYAAALDDGRLATCKGLRLNDDDLIRREVIERLMCDMRIDLAAIGERFAIDAASYFATSLAALDQAERDGLLTRDGLVLEATPVGRLLIRHLAMAFDTTLTQQSPARYSRIL